MNKLYVFGHTKPDTDSIASAIVFAKLQKALNPIGDIPTFPFSSERKVYMDDVWNEIEKYI